MFLDTLDLNVEEPLVGGIFPFVGAVDVEDVVVYRYVCELEIVTLANGMVTYCPFWRFVCVVE